MPPTPTGYETHPDLAFDRLAVASRFVARHDADAALDLAARIERELGLALSPGRILYERGFLRPAEVEAILAAQARAGRRPAAADEFAPLKLSPPEHRALEKRLLRRGVLTTGDLEEGGRVSERLASLGIRIDSIEALWLAGRIPAAEIQDVLDHQREGRRRVEPAPGPVPVPLPRSAGSFGDSPDPAGCLFGLLARSAGVVDQAELDQAHADRRRLEADGLSISLERVLFERHGGDPDRYRRLVEVRERHHAILPVAGFRGPGAPQGSRLSPLEREAIAASLAEQPPEHEVVERARRRIQALARIGIEVGLEDALLEDLEGAGPADRRFAEVLAARSERDRRLLGAWNREAESIVPAGRDLLEEAFAAETEHPHWDVPSLGAIAVDRRVVDSASLARALAIQLRASQLGVFLPIGEILLELGSIDRGALRDLLRRQIELADRMPRPHGPEEADEVLLHQGLARSGAVEEKRIEEALWIRDRLRALGLVHFTLREVLVASGDVDEEVADGLVRVGRGRAPAVRRGDLRERLTSAAREAAAAALAPRPKPVPVGWTVGRRLAALVAVAALAASLWGLDRAARTGPLPPPPDGPVAALEPRPEPGADPAAFARAMGDRGFVRIDGRWVEAGSIGGSDRPSKPAGPTLAGRRAEFGWTMTEQGYVPARGGWMRPDALSRLAESEERADLGLVRATGRWRRLTDLARRPIRTAPGAGIDSLQARLVVDQGRTRIGLRLESSLPAGSRLVLTLAGAHRPGQTFHAGWIRLPATGALELEADPIPRPLRAGRYRVALDFPRAYQVDPTAGPARPSRWEIDVDLAPLADGLEVDVEFALLSGMLEQLTRCLTHVERDPDTAAMAAADALETLGRLGTVPAGPGRAGLRNGLARAARLLAEVLAATAMAAEGRRLRIEEARHEIERIRNALALN